MTRTLRERGFAAEGILIGVVVIALIGFLGYVYLKKNQQTASTTPVNQSRVATDTPAAPAVNSTADLDNAEKVLDSTDPSGSNNADASTLDTQVASF